MPTISLSSKPPAMAWSTAPKSASPTPLCECIILQLNNNTKYYHLLTISKHGLPVPLWLVCLRPHIFLIASLTSAQNPRKTPPYLQSHPHTRAQFGILCRCLQAFHDIPTSNIPSWQGTFVSQLHRWFDRRLFGLWKRHTEQRQSANCHLRLRQGDACSGEAICAEKKRRWRWCRERFEGESATECLASVCESELGYGHVGVQVVSRYHSDKLEEQHEVHVSVSLLMLFDARKLKAFAFCKNLQQLLTLLPVLDTLIRIIGTVSGLFWYKINRAWDLTITLEYR